MRRLVCVFGLVATLGQTVEPSAVGAQEAPEAPPPAEVHGAESEEQARQQFKQGVAALERRDFVAALEAFERSYGLNPAPVALYNMALVLVDMGRRAEGWNRFREYLIADTDLTPDERREIELLMDDLAKRVGLVDFHVTPPQATVTIDGVDITAQADSPWALEPGAHVISIEADGHRPLEVHALIDAGARRVMTHRLAPLTPEHPMSESRSAPLPKVERGRSSDPLAARESSEEQAAGGLWSSPFFWIAAAVVVTSAVGVGVWIAANQDGPLEDVDAQAVVLRP